MQQIDGKSVTNHAVTLPFVDGHGHYPWDLEDQGKNFLMHDNKRREIDGEL